MLVRTLVRSYVWPVFLMSTSRLRGDTRCITTPAVRSGSSWHLINAGCNCLDDQPRGQKGFDYRVLETFRAGAGSGLLQSLAPFTIRVAMDQVQANVAEGLEMTTSEDSALSVYCDGHFGDQITVHGISLKGSQLGV